VLRAKLLKIFFEKVRAANFVVLLAAIEDVTIFLIGSRAFDFAGCAVVYQSYTKHSGLGIYFWQHG
jgi:hypothetical protein